MIFWRCGFSATKSQTALIRERCTTNPDKQNVLKGDNQPDNDKKTHFTPNPTTGNSGPNCCWWLFDSNNNLNNNNNLLNNPKAAANVDIYSSGGKTSIAHYVKTCERERPVNQILWLLLSEHPPSTDRMLSFKKIGLRDLNNSAEKERENSW